MFEIIERYTRALLYRSETASTVAEAVSEAVKADANLTRANLTRANLTGAKGVNAFRTTPLLLLKDQPGKIRAYKLVDERGEGPFSRSNGFGALQYHIGSSCEVEEADTDANNQCAAGINLATLNWCMKEWKSGYRILVAEFEAADIAAVPTATDGKFRVFRCSIVGEKDLTEIGLVAVEER